MSGRRFGVKFLLGCGGPVALSALAILGLTGCGGSGKTVRPVDPEATRALARARGVCRSANIVICCIDAARRDHIGFLGYSRATTPEIDRLAPESVCFENAVTEASYTLAAVASLWTGQYPDSHGVSVVGMRIPLELTTLPEACRAAGMRTAVISSSGNVIRAHGFGDGVEDFVRVLTTVPDAGQVPGLRRAWRTWLQGVGDQRFFLYVHIIPPHHPYELAGPFKGSFDPDYRGSLGPTEKIMFDVDSGKQKVSARDRLHLVAMYDEALRYADWAVGALVQDLRERRKLDNTIFVLFSDHGEAFGEHGRWLHANTVYNELTHTLMLVRLPPEVRGERQAVSGLAQLCDLAPTLASLAGLEFPADQTEGYDLAPEMFGAGSVRRAAFSRCLPEPRPRWSVQTAAAKGIFDEAGALSELYGLKTDSGEKANLVGQEPTMAASVTRAWTSWAKGQQLLHAKQSKPSNAAHLDEKTRKWLRGLGYL